VGCGVNDRGTAAAVALRRRPVPVVRAFLMRELCGRDEESTNYRYRMTQAHEGQYSLKDSSFFHSK
jgi:hypothetical protein